MKTIFLFCLIAEINIPMGFGQVLMQKINPSSIDKSSSNLLENAPTILMPKFTFDLIQKQYEDSRSIVPPRFGYAFKTDINNQNNGSWVTSGQKKIWSLTIKSEGALSINLIFSYFYLSEGSEFYIYNDTRDTKFGPVLYENNSVKRKLATDIFDGPSVTLILFEPISSKTKSSISVSRVIHGYATYCSFDDATLECHINASCSQADGLANEKNAIARILVNDGQSCCSGTLINNACYNYIPYFLTAFHCIDFDEDRELDIDEIGDIDTWAFSYKYISPNCTPSSQPSSWITFSGASYRAANDESDFLLTEMDTKPNSTTGLTYSGWSNSDNFPFEDQGTRALHHPGGDVMKFSSSTDEPSENANPVRFYYEYPNSYFDMAAGTLWELYFNNGATEGGSSGSPLFDPNNRSIGQLVGNITGCPPELAYYGKFNESWDRSAVDTLQLEHWLDPENLGSTSVNTVLIPYITGHSIVCYSPSKTFNLYNRAADSVYWTKSSNLYIVSGQNTNALTVRALSSTSSGEGWVQANLYIETCGVVTVRYENFWVGVPEPTIDGEQYPGCGDINWYFLDPDDYWGTYSWSVTYQLSILGSSLGKKAQIRADEEGTATIYCDVTNTCGTNHGSLQVWADCWGFFMSPNPANEYVEITIDDTKTDISKLGEYNINIINAQNMTFSQLRTAQPSIRVSTKDLLPGMYVVQLIYKEKSYTKQLVVSH